MQETSLSWGPALLRFRIWAKASRPFFAIRGISYVLGYERRGMDAASGNPKHHPVTT